MARDAGDPLVWIDCEMTGLDLSRDLLLEVAVLVTDSELNVLDGDGLDLVLGAPAQALESMVEVVARMHTESGLLAEAARSPLTLPTAQEQLLGYIRQFVPEPGRAPLCGNSIATDRGFLSRDMPELDAWLHYRMIDVSSVKELCRRWFPRVYYQAPAKAGGHRALADIRESIDELRYYRSTVFVPPPGPDSGTARAAAEAVSGDADSATARS